MRVGEFEITINDIRLYEIRSKIFKELNISGKFPNEIRVTASEWSVLVDEIYKNVDHPSISIMDLKSRRGYFGNLFGIPLFVEDDPA